jgi:hypothetical protein
VPVTLVATGQTFDEVADERLGSDDADKIEQWPIDRADRVRAQPAQERSCRRPDGRRDPGVRLSDPLCRQSDGRLVDGHLRLKAARKLGLDTVPVILADDLTPTQIKAFRLLANRSATWAGGTTICCASNSMS